MNLNKSRLLLISLLAFMSCNPIPTYEPYEYSTDPVYTQVKIESFGNYFEKNNIPSSVFSMTLLTSKLTESDGSLSGTGQRLYFENIFAPSNDSILPAGTYTASETGDSFTFYPGSIKQIDNISYSTGTSIDFKEKQVSKNKTQLIINGSFYLSYLHDSLLISFDMQTQDGINLKGYYKGKNPKYTTQIGFSTK
jgi:hypothetical protein